MSKRILIFSIAYDPYIGGAEVAIKEITDRIDDIVFDMITLRFDSNLPAFERIGNVNVYRIGFTQDNPKMADLIKFPLVLNKYLLPFLATIKAIFLNRKYKYDIVWAMMAYAGFAAMFFKTLNPKVKFLLSLQEGDPISDIKEKVRYVYPLFKRIFSRADFVQAISNHLADFAKGMGYNGPVRVIPNAVDIKLFSKNYTQDELSELKNRLAKKEGDIFLISTSRLVPKNAYDDVIQSLTLLPSQVKLLVLGDGPDKDELLEICRELGVSDRVEWIGFVDQKEIPKYLKVSDIFVRPSLSEGLGNSFLEAMAAGIPIIATPVGGIVDFLFDPEKNPNKEATGLFCEVKNPKSIAMQVSKIINNPELKMTLIKNAETLVRSKYDWDVVSVEMKNLFIDEL